MTGDSGRQRLAKCEYDAAYYDVIGNNYRERREFRLANLWRAAYISGALRPASVLDVGGGMGLLVEQLRVWGHEALGLELSRYAITQAPHEIRRTFIQGSLMALPFAEAAFDVVVSVNVLEHMYPSQVAGALAECARVARRGLYHEITVLEDSGVIHRDPTHRSKLAAREWLKVLTERHPGWQARRGPVVPRYKNGIFLLTRSAEARPPALAPEQPIEVLTCL